MAGLPILPGLMSSQDQPTDDDGDKPVEAANALAQYLDTLDDSQVQELVSSAEEYDQANPDPEPDADDEPPTSERGEADGKDDPSDDDETTGSEDEPSDDESNDDDGNGEPTAADLETISTHLDADVEEAASIVTAIEQMGTGDDEFAAVLKPLGKVAGQLQEKIETCQKLGAKAVKKEDPHGAAQAGMSSADALDALKAIQDAARLLGRKSEAPKATPADHPALKAWAERMQDKKPAAPSV